MWKFCGDAVSAEFRRKLYCLKSVQIRSFFWSVFSRIRAEYEEIRSISPYSVWMRENTDQKKLRIWTLFTQFFPCTKSNKITLSCTVYKTISQKNTSSNWNFVLILLLVFLICGHNQSFFLAKFSFVECTLKACGCYLE